MSEVQKIQWFPGHMTKTKRQIQEKLKLVDAVAEIIDSRIPISSRNPDLDDILKSKPRIILMNKSDMANPNNTNEWIEYYKKKGITALAIDCRSGKGINTFFSDIKILLKDQIESWANKGMTGRVIRVMVVGVPNVGKSSFINKTSNGSKAKVEDRPGVTRGNQWFTIRKGFELLDTPGVLWPKFEDPVVGERLAFTGAVKDQILDIELLARRLLEFLNKENQSTFKIRYKLQDIDTSKLDGNALLKLIGKKRGMLISGGEIDVERASIMVLDEFRAAKLGRITLEKVKD